MRNLLVCLLVAAGCGGGGSNGDGKNPDGNNNNPDAAVDAPPAPVMLTISGTATARNIAGTTPVADVVVAAYRSSDENTALASTMTDAQGKFSLTVMTNGEGIVGFLKATKPGFTTSYLYPHRAVTEDLAMVPMNMLTTGTFDDLSTIAQGNQQLGMGVVALIVLEGPMFTSNAVMGATISTTPGSNPYRYNGASGLPNSTATSTAADGVAYAFNAPPGAITVTAEKQGVTFQPTNVKAFADSLTQTLVSP